MPIERWDQTQSHLTTVREQAKIDLRKQQDKIRHRHELEVAAGAGAILYAAHKINQSQRTPEENRRAADDTQGAAVVAVAFIGFFVIVGLIALAANLIGQRQGAALDIAAVLVVLCVAAIWIGLIVVLSPNVSHNGAGKPGVEVVDVLAIHEAAKASPGCSYARDTIAAQDAARAAGDPNWFGTASGVVR